MLDYERVGKRLADARRRRTAAKLTIAAANEIYRKADLEIEECLDELESGEASRPLLDAIESKGEADEHQRGPTNYDPRRTATRGRHKRGDGSVRTVVLGGDAVERPDRKVRPRGDDAATIERLAREATSNG